MSTDAQRWSELLAAYERHLDDQEAFLELAARPGNDDDLVDVTPPAAFVVPHGFPVAPAHLLDRLTELHERTLALVARTGDTLDALERPANRRRITTAETSAATILDRAL